MTLFGLFFNVDMYYIHESSSDLIKLPAFPISIDYDRLRKSLYVVEYFQKNKLVTKEEFKSYLKDHGVYHDDELIQLLYHEVDEYVEPSAFFVLLDQSNINQFKKILITDSALDQYEKTSGNSKKQFDHIISRLPDPLYRKQKDHLKGEITWIKPGNTSERLAYFEEADSIIVCEVLLHDAYEKRLQKPIELGSYTKQKRVNLNTETVVNFIDESSLLGDKVKLTNDLDESLEIAEELQLTITVQLKEIEILKKTKFDLEEKLNKEVEKVSEIQEAVSQKNRELSQVRISLTSLENRIDTFRKSFFKRLLNKF